MPVSNNLKVAYEKVTDIRPNARNSRDHSRKQISQIEKSIRQFGFANPVLVDEHKILIAGHGRWEAARNLGFETLPCVMLAGLSEPEKRALLIADNRLTENAGWNLELLGQELEDLRGLDLDFDISITGIELPEINSLIEAIHQKPEKEEAPPLLELPAVAVSRPGDLWLLGDHRVLCGSSLDPENWAALMGDARARLAFTDPPYNVPISGHVSGLGKHQHREFAEACGEMKPAEFTAFLKTALSNLAAFSVDGSIHYICMDWRHLAELLEATSQVYSEIKNLCVWAKDNAGMGSFYRSAHELVLVAKHGTAPHINNFSLGQFGRHRTNVWSYPGANSFAGRKGEDGNPLAMHPTVKPVAMVADAILDCSSRGDVVTDAFLGSGSTLIAAQQTGRRCYGIEIDPLYVDLVLERWRRRTGLQPVLAGSMKEFNIINEERNGS